MTRASLVALAGKTSQGEEEEKEGRGGGETTPQGRVHTIAVACQRRGEGEGTEKDEGLWRVTE